VRFGCEAETADGGVLPVEVALRPAGDGTTVATVRRPPSGTAGDPGNEPGAGRGRLEERNEHLRLLNRILRHDVRNDMAVVHGWSEELAETLDGRRGEIADGIRESSEHVVGITGAVGDLMDAIDGDAAGSAVDLREVLLGELDRREATFPDATFEVGSVPDVEVAADDLLGSVFRNLLNNAVQHSDRPRPRVEVSVEATDRSVVVSVADDGPGIPDGRREAVFGRTEEGLDHPAAGLGLYLVDALVSKYGGDVWVEDRRPRGAVFRVELPRVRARGRGE
jgi:signal transduction histidine kinase